MPEVEWLIAGGGPAGATAAILLGRQGRNVTLVERCAEPTHKVCGEFLSGEALGYLQGVGVDVWKLGAQPIRKVRLIGRDVIAEAALPFRAASLSRKAMDGALLCAAREAGVNLILGRKVEELVPAVSGWRARLDDQREIRGAQAMLATGKHDLRGHARGPGRQRGLVAFKLHMKLQSEQRQRLEETVEIALFPGGYLGLQPTETGAANLCLLIHERRLRALGGGWAGVLQHLVDSSPVLRERLAGAEPAMPRPLAVSHIPYGYLRAEAPPGLWVLGDQAAVIPSFSGDGMSIALHSAHVAAALVQAGGTSAALSERLRATHRTQLFWATLLSRVLVDAPALASLVRWSPALLRRFASSTRIPGSPIVPASQGVLHEHHC